jgi:hypothetical protein
MCDVPLSNFAVKFNLRRYTVDQYRAMAQQKTYVQVGSRASAAGAST